MRRFRFFALTTFAAAAVLATAQTPLPSKEAAPVPTQQTDATADQYRIPEESTLACPVGFSVARRSATDFLSASSAARRPDAQAIEVVLQPSKQQRIRSAELVVHAYSGGAALLPVQRRGTGPLVVDRSFHLDATSAGVLRHSLVLERVNGVESVDLVAVHFADGQNWRAAGNEACRAVPSLSLAIGESPAPAIPH